MVTTDRKPGSDYETDGISQSMKFFDARYVVHQANASLSMSS
jgi:hypothetical protein